MKRIYVNHNLWEEHKAGMYHKLHKSDEQRMLSKAIAFTGDHVAYGEAMKEVVSAWPNTMLHNLTNKSNNRRAFVGHCAAMYKIGSPEYITIMAWNQLSQEQQRLANAVADLAIKHWQKIIAYKYGEQTTF